MELGKQGWRKRRSEQEQEEGTMNESVCEIRAGKHRGSDRTQATLLSAKIMRVYEG